jgi:CubicO group peptidase (beta-lactamase class C family)
MTKPVTAVATMMLVEDGRIDLEERLASYLPEVSSVKVGIETLNSRTGIRSLSLVSPDRPPTVQDVMRHTAGFVYANLGSGLVHQSYEKADVLNWKITTAEMMTRLSALPLAYQPGTQFEYSMSYDVLGRLIEVTSGESLDKYIEQRIAVPLGLKSFKFHVERGRQWAFSTLLASFKKDQDPDASAHEDPKLLSGGGGLYATAGDYLRFAQMLLNGGELNGVRILAPRTVSLMTHNHLGPDVEVSSAMRNLLLDIAPTPEMGQGFGLGFAVRVSDGQNPLPGSIGDFDWAGAGGTYFWVDPRERLVAVVMVPVATGGLERKYRQYSRQLVYQALTTSTLGDGAR